jgi:uncharacterized membrane protein required for colicin V production
MLVIMLRAFHIGKKNGIVVEFFKLLGILFAAVVSCHYYSRMATALHDVIRIPPSIGEGFSFLLLWVLSVLLFKLIRDGIMILLKIEAHADIEKWIGVVLSFVRGLVICSLIVVNFQISGVKYLNNYAKESFFGPAVSEIAPIIYEFSYSHLITKLFPEEKPNTRLFLFRDLLEKK